MAIIRCATEDQIQSQLLRAIQQCVDSNQSDLFTCGLSGGSLPSVLAKVLPRVSTNWSKWRFLFCDERLVPFDDNESTFGVYKKQLLDTFPSISADQFVKVDPNLPPESAAKDYEQKMRSVFGSVVWPQFDILLLGMGPDGHTCSLFPNHALLKESIVWCASIDDSPKPPPKRVTLTLPVLNNAKCCVIYAVGASKADVLKEILVEGKPLPAALIRPSKGSVVWILDVESARLIPEDIF